MIPLVDFVCNEFGVNKDELFTKTRKREIVDARNVCMAIMRDYTPASFQRIGEYFFRDHATVLFATKSVQNHYQTEKEFRDRYDRVKTACDDKRIDIPLFAFFVSRISTGGKMYEENFIELQS